MLTKLKYHSKKKKKEKKTDLGIKVQTLKLDNYNNVAFHEKKHLISKNKKFVPCWQKSFNKSTMEEY